MFIKRKLFGNPFFLYAIISKFFYVHLFSVSPMGEVLFAITRHEVICWTQSPKLNSLPSSRRAGLPARQAGFVALLLKSTPLLLAKMSSRAQRSDLLLWNTKQQLALLTAGGLRRFTTNAKSTLVRSSQRRLFYFYRIIDDYFGP